jgi:hypothetical protein
LHSFSRTLVLASHLIHKFRLAVPQFWQK